MSEDIKALAERMLACRDISQYERALAGGVLKLLEARNDALVAIDAAERLIRRAYPEENTPMRLQLTGAIRAALKEPTDD